VKPVTLIVHFRADDVVPFGDELHCCERGLPAFALVEVGHDNRLGDPKPLEALLRSVDG